MRHLLARHVAPLTYLLWLLVAIGLADEFLGPFLPPIAVEIGLVALWLVAALTWFGFRQKKRDDAARRRHPPDR